jgi:hypothetical protein
MDSDHGKCPMVVVVPADSESAVLRVMAQSDDVVAAAAASSSVLSVMQSSKPRHSGESHCSLQRVANTGEEVIEVLLERAPEIDALFPIFQSIAKTVYLSIIYVL